MRFLLCFMFLVMTNGKALASTESIDLRESIDDIQNIVNENAGTEREDNTATRLANQMLEQDKSMLNNQEGE